MSCKQMVATELCFSITNRDLKCAVKSASYSKSYVKKIVKASFLNILYHRLNVDVNQFQHKSYEDIPYVTFKPKATDKYIRRFHDWMYGFSDALNKGYIKDVHLFMLNSNDLTPIEKYKFHLKYTEEHQTPVESAALSDVTKNFLKTLELLGDHPKLADGTELKVEFAYYDNTPRDYEPPGFEASTNTLALKTAETGIQDTLYLGRLDTGYHTLTCSARGRTFSVSRSATPAPSVTALKLSQIEEESPRVESEVFQIPDDDTSKAIVNGDEDETEYFPTEAPSPQRDCVVLSDTSLDVRQVSDADIVNITLGSVNDVVPNPVVNNCICQIDVSILDIDIITCTKCGNHYHAPCHGYYDKSYTTDYKFVCVICDKHNIEDKYLSQMSVGEYSSFASTRLFLLLIYNQRKVPTDIMKLLPKKRAALILNKLKSNGVVTKNAKEGIVINQTTLAHYVINFFIQRESQTLNTETQDHDIPSKKRTRID